MKKKELSWAEGAASMKSEVNRKKLPCDIDPLIRKITGLSQKETPATKRRFRVMKNMAKEMMEQGFYPEEKSPEEFLAKFFSEIYSGQ